MKIRDRIPPGLVTVVIIYGLFVGFLIGIRHFGLSDFFFPRQFMTDLTAVAVVLGPLYIVYYYVSYFHPEWRDWSKDNNFTPD
jgi:hypothetical protein